MVLDLFLIGTAITLGPLHNTAFILLLATKRGVRNGLVFIMSWLTNLVVVIAAVLLLTGGTPPGRDTAPSTAATAVKLTIGVGLIVYGEQRRRLSHARSGQPRPHQPPKWAARLDRASGWTAAGLAVLLQPWGMVGAAAATAVDADVSSAASVWALIGFCVLATAGLLAMELYTVFAPEAAHAGLGRLRDRLDRNQEQVVVVLTLLLGLYLVGRSIDQLVG